VWTKLRKLLIKLVAIETALVGWLAYWIFLVYANNPSVADELSTSLQRFPQLSFSTVDIAVLVIIASLAVTLAYKFQRGLRPGIRLERALQMLENLMKRNLVLEAQVAELKIEKSHGPILTTPPPIMTPTPPTTVEPRQGSWEKAFRTPLEAGPPISTKASGTTSADVPFGKETGVPPPRIEPKPQPNISPMAKPPIVIGERGSERVLLPPTVITEKMIDKPSPPSPPTTASTNWEDSPQFIGESKGILTPSRAPRKIPAVSESGGLKTPYIPSPAPKMTSPSVVVGPMSSPTPPRIALSSQKTLTRPRPGLTQTKPPIIASPTSPSPFESPKPPAVPELALPSSLTPPPTPPTLDNESPTKSDDSATNLADQAGKSDMKGDSKSASITKKKSPLDEHE
jgi:hypothetical protein